MGEVSYIFLQFNQQGIKQDGTMSGQKLLLNPLHCQKTVCKGRFCVLPDPYFTHQATAIPIRKVNISVSGSVLSSTSMETQAGC